MRSGETYAVHRVTKAKCAETHAVVVACNARGLKRFNLRSEIAEYLTRTAYIKRVTNSGALVHVEEK